MSPSHSPTSAYANASLPLSLAARCLQRTSIVLFGPLIRAAKASDVHVRGGTHMVAVHTHARPMMVRPPNSHLHQRTCHEFAHVDP